MGDKTKKQNTFRLVIQCLSFAFQNGYISGWKKGTIYSGYNKAFCVPGLNCYSCPGAIGACPIGSLQAVLDSGKFHFSLYVFGFIGLVGMISGRFVCGWLCPFGLIQDLMHKVPLKKKRRNLPGHRYLRYLRYAVLLLFVILLPMFYANGKPWFCEYICPSGTLLGGIPLILMNAGLRVQIGPRFYLKVFLLLLFLLGAVAFYRPFCKYVCPLGALYGLANPVSLYRLKVDRDSCVSCGACKNACGMDINVWENPNSAECIRCGKCMAACPHGAISTTFSKSKKEVTEVTPADNVQPFTEEAVTGAEENTAQRRPSAWLIILSVASIMITGILFYAFYYAMAASVVFKGVSSDILLYGRYMFVLFGAFVPTVMLTIFCVLILVSVKKPQLLSSLKDWPGKLLKLTGAALLIEFIVYFIIATASAGALSPAGLLMSPLLMLHGLPVFLALILIILIFRISMKKI